ncbi:MAG: YggS family pyridoxal phosphate-dependent enzyme [Clostridia bacterium]|nr:YggS family pyridoxal phosphate-dependent enzyme [Clostridia bacterium]
MGRDEQIRDNLARVRETLTRAAAQAGRPTPTLIGVTKRATDEEMIALIRLGVADVGENYPQALARRAEMLDGAGLRPRMHLIGHLQTNKVRLVVGRAALIHSLDSERLALCIERTAAQAGVIQPVLVEINVGREPDKTGVLPEQALPLCRAVAALPHLRLRGLMTMAPPADDPEDSRPYFRLVKGLFDEGRRAGLFGDEPVLSMGMSRTCAVAAEEGATMVRVGSALFSDDI